MRLGREDGRTFTASPLIYSAADQACFRPCRIEHLVRYSILPEYARQGMATREVIEFTLTAKREAVAGWGRQHQENRIYHPNLCGESAAGL